MSVTKPNRKDFLMTSPNDLPRQAVAELDDENRKAEEHIEQGDLQSAARILVGIVEKDNRNWRAYNNMGIVAWMQRAWHDAYTMFEKAVTLKPDYTDAVANLFDAALKLKKVKDIVPLLDKSLELQPDSEETRVIRNAIGDQGDDIYLSQRGLSIGTYNPGIDQANKLLEDGQLNQAMEIFLKVNDEEGPNSDAFAGLGVISYYQKRYKDAFTLFLESIKLNPTSSDHLLNLLDAAKECGRVEDAKKVYATCLKDFPFLETIKENFEKASSGT